MNISILKKYYFRFITMGADIKTSKRDLKKIKLFNLFTLAWYILVIILLFKSYFSSDQEYKTIVLHLIISGVLIIAQLLHKKKKFITARLLFIFCVFVVAFYYSNILSLGNYSELYYFIASPICVILIDNKYINYTVLAIAILLYTIPNMFLDIYPKGNHLIFIIINIVLFFTYSASIKNEQALETKTKELAVLSEFQSQFFINISHEIRTPLTLIKGQISNLNTVLNKAPEVIIIQKKLNKQVLNITKIVDDVLDLAKMETSSFSLNIQEVNITEVIAKIYLSFESVFKQKNINFIFFKDDKNYIARVDIIYLEKAINNIVLNALKYTEQGTVSLKLIKVKEKIQIVIEDTGIGMSEQDVKNICKRFYQVNNKINKSGGNGIGLAFSNEIIKHHKGELVIKSTLNEGSSFKIILPLLRVEKDKKNRALPLIKIDKVNVTDKEPVKEPVTKLTKKIVLIVDDNFDMRKYLKEILTTYHCVEAENGLEALHIIENNVAIDFIITDYMMPKMDGYDFIKALKEKGIEIPILMLTAKTDNENKLGILKLGIDDYLHKPFEKEELLIRIDNSLKNYIKRDLFLKKRGVIYSDNQKINQWINKVREYIYNECGNVNFVQADILEHFSISKSSLYRKIKSETGLTPNEFITEIKLLKAREILEKNSNKSLKSLSLDVGFLHSFYFSKLYEKRFGNKPFVNNPD